MAMWGIALSNLLFIASAAAFARCAHWLALLHAILTKH